MARITKIEAKAKSSRGKKIRVAAYARVSTNSDEQLLSLEVQKEHYESYIKSNPSWDYAGLYFDEGISGTKIEKRESLLRLLEDCKEGKIDRVITKSISRFSRNTVDCLEMVRKLTGLGIYLYFEKENIDTEHMSSELMLSILSSIAEGESRSISENAKWSIQRRFEEGSYIIAYPPYGYKNEDGKMVVVPEEAAVVKDIFKMALSGMGGYRIARSLNERNIPTKKKSKWCATTVVCILKNEKYTSDVIFQKTYTDENFNRHTNRGEKDQYKMANHHEAIISHEDFASVQEIIKQRKAKINVEGMGEKYRNRYAFTGRIYCGECQSKLKRSIQYKQSSKHITWKCIRHIADKTMCSLKSVQDAHIKLAFLQMLNKLRAGHAQVIDPLIAGLRGTNNKEKLKQVLELEGKIEKLHEQEQVLTKLLSSGYVEPDAFYQENNQLKAEIDAFEKEKLLLSNSLNGNLLHLNEAQKLRTFVSKKDPFTEFSDTDFLELIDSVVVQGRTSFTFYLKCGLDLREEVMKK